METDVRTLQSNPDNLDKNGSWILYATIGWLALVILGSVWLSVTIFGLANFGDLGRPVQYFVGGVALVPALASIYASIMLLMKRPAGRYAAMAVLYTGCVLSIATLLTVWNVWDGYEFIVDGIMIQPYVLLGFAAAYAMNWIALRFDDSHPARATVQNVALGLAALTLVIMLWFSGLLNGIMYVMDRYIDFSAGLSLESPGMQAWVTTISIVVFGWLAYQMLNMGDVFGETPFEREAWQGWLMLSPNILGFVIFFAGPLLLSFYLSFTNDTIGNVPEVIWFENYADLIALEFKPFGDATFAQDVLSFGFSELTTINWLGTQYVIGAQDVLFWRSLGNTLLFCLMLVPLSTIPAIGLALILNSDLPGMKFFRAVYFLPSVAAVVGTALIWRWLYDPTIGFINYALTQINPGGERILWLSDPNVVLISIVLLASWQVVGFNTVLFLAGLQGIPNVLYEAAMIDGANNVQRFRFVTFPLLGPTTFFVVITTVIQGLQVFNEPYTLFPARPIPTNATTSVYYMYTQGFLESQFGYASAVAWVLFLVIFLITLVQFRVQQSEAY